MDFLSQLSTPLQNINARQDTVFYLFVGYSRPVSRPSAHEITEDGEFFVVDAEATFRPALCGHKRWLEAFLSRFLRAGSQLGD
jgi:hypothetical protein